MKMISFGLKTTTDAYNLSHYNHMTIEKILRGTVLAAVFALPFIVLYVADSMFFPYISGKNFAFRILVEIAASAWLALAILNPAYRPRHTWLLWAFAALVAIMAVADAFGVYPFKSFWSNFERMDGFVTLAHLFVYFVVATAVLNTERLWRLWWHTTLVVSFVVACTGLFQMAGFIEGSTRLDARIGNPTYLGVYMLFHVFIAAFLLVRTWTQEPRNRRVALWFYGTSMLLNSFVLFYTATRGAMLGLLGGLVFAAFLYAFIAPDPRARRIAAGFLAGAAVLAGIFWMARETAFVRSVLPLYRVANLLEDTTTHSRFMNWGMAWEGVKERPLLGWGHENYSAVFDKYYDPGMYAQEPWFDRVHNVIFDWLVAGGVLGLFAYLSLYLFALLALWRSGAFLPQERALFTGLFAGYFFYLLFTFDNILSYILFVSVLAYITMRATDGQTSGWTPPRGAAPVIFGGALLLAGSMVWFVNADAMRQNLGIIAGLRPHADGPTHNLAAFEQVATIRGPGLQEAREQFSQAAIRLLSQPNQPTELKEQFARAAATELEKQVNEAPLNARAPLFLGSLLDRVGAYEEALPLLEEARRRSPQKQTVLIELGSNAFARGALDEGVAFFKEAYEVEPAYTDAKVFYAGALLRAERDAEAQPVLEELKARGAAAHQHIAAVLAERKQYDTIVDIWRAHIEQKPLDSQARFLLAVALYESGDVATAIQELEMAKTTIPEAAAQADQLLAQMRAER